LDLILECDIVMFILYSIINIDLNVPCYVVSIEEMTNDYLIDKIYNKKDSCLFHICMLKLNETIWCNTCSHDQSTKFDKIISIIMNFNSI